ncbi:hypothetical protein EKH55_1788 [Sinorhizobium alkalisoli]|nr:hypothetical protein EKH55_1788 [Sinorhizobium alkalisoli]
MLGGIFRRLLGFLGHGGEYGETPLEREGGRSTKGKREAGFPGNCGLRIRRSAGGHRSRASRRFARRL